MTVGRVLAVVVLAGLILFPGVELLRFLFADVLGVYREMSLTDCLLFFVIVLLCALLLQRRGEEPRLRAVGNRPVEETGSPAAATAPASPPQPRRRRRHTVP